MARQITLRADDPHAITGPRSRVLAHYKQYGVAMWLRADGRATLLYSDAGHMRSHTWQRFTFTRVHADAAFDWAAALIVRTDGAR